MVFIVNLGGGFEKKSCKSHEKTPGFQANLIQTQAIQSKFICSILPNIGRISRPDCKGV